MRRLVASKDGRGAHGIEQWQQGSTRSQGQASDFVDLETETFIDIRNVVNPMPCTQPESNMSGPEHRTWLELCRVIRSLNPHHCSWNTRDCGSPRTNLRHRPGMFQGLVRAAF